MILVLLDEKNDPRHRHAKIVILNLAKQANHYEDCHDKPHGLQQTTLHYINIFLMAIFTVKAVAVIRPCTSLTRHFWMLPQQLPHSFQCNRSQPVWFYKCPSSDIVCQLYVHSISFGLRCSTSPGISSPPGLWTLIAVTTSIHNPFPKNSYRMVWSFLLSGIFQQSSRNETVIVFCACNLYHQCHGFFVRLSPISGAFCSMRLLFCKSSMGWCPSMVLRRVKPKDAALMLLAEKLKVLLAELKSWENLISKNWFHETMVANMANIGFCLECAGVLELSFVAVFAGQSKSTADSYTSVCCFGSVLWFFPSKKRNKW